MSILVKKDVKIMIFIQIERSIARKRVVPGTWKFTNHIFLDRQLNVYRDGSILPVYICMLHHFTDHRWHNFKWAIESIFLYRRWNIANSSQKYYYKWNEYFNQIKRITFSFIIVKILWVKIENDTRSFPYLKRNISGLKIFLKK